jgi:hypothetical protein
MREILCFGDSNTYGLIPGTKERYKENIRWTGILQQKLKEQDDEDLVDAVTAADQVYKAVSVTADNIVSLMMDRPKFSQATLTIQENAIRHLRDLL